MDTSKKIDTSSRIKEIILSTGNVNRPYIVRDIVFAADKIEVDLFDPEIDLNALLSDVAFRLKEKAHSYGANAVINCHFEHDRIVENGKTFFRNFCLWNSCTVYTIYNRRLISLNNKLLNLDTTNTINIKKESVANGLFFSPK